MSSVEVVYFLGCPNALKVMDLLRRGGIDFREVHQDKLVSSDSMRSYSSPSIFVDGRLILGTKCGGAGSCTYEAIDSEDVLGKVRAVLRGLNP